MPRVSGLLTCPLTVVKARRQILQPRRLDGYVVVRESRHFTEHFADPCIESVGLALLRLKQIAETARVPATKVLGCLPGLVADLCN